MNTSSADEVIDPALDSVERYHRFRGPVLYGYESGEQDGGDYEPTDDAEGVPVVPLTDPREREQERYDRGRYRGRPEVDYLHPEAPGALVENDG
jgi:hypothetical protein